MADNKTAGDAFVYKAKLAEQAERYDDMAEAMKELVNTCIGVERPSLTVEERNLLSVSYKNSVGTRRASWRIISNIEQKEQSKGSSQYESLASEYRKLVEDELAKICNDIISLLSQKLIPSAVENESKVFYYKMEGDYFRYISEILSDEQRKEVSDSAHVSYQAATDTAANSLPPTHPIRLGLALNFSVFYYEILNSPYEACNMAKKAFDDAIAEFENVSDESYKDSTLIMQLLRDNLTLWTSDLRDQETEEKAPANGDP